MSEMLDAPLDTPAPTNNPTGDLMDDFVASLVSPEAPKEPEKPTEQGTPKEPEKPKEGEEAPKEPEKPKEADGEEIPKEPKNRKDWDTLRGSRDRWKQTAEETQTAVAAKEQIIQTMTQELEELRSKAARLPELEERMKDLDSYEKELAVTRLEATREYREAIAKPLQAIGQAVDMLAKANEADTDKVLDMLREPDPAKQRAAFKELTVGWDDVDKADLWTAAKDARVILDKQDQMREHASSAAKEQAELAAKREQEEAVNRKKEFTTSLKDVVKSLGEKTPFIPLAEGETAEDRYRALEQKVSEVDFDTQTPRGKAFAAAAAILHPKMIQTIQKLQEENQTLRARVKAENSAKPSVSPTEQSRPASEEPQDFLTAMGVPTAPTLSKPLNVVGVH